MALEHRGNAELLNGLGEVVDHVTVSLQARPATGIRRGSWGGHIQPREGLGPDWDGVVTIRLEDGTEAPIVITKDRFRSAESDTIRTGTIQGSGSPPF